MKKTKKMSERLLEAFAAVIKFAAPIMSCKYFTKKYDRRGRENKKAELFIPSLEAQEKAFDQMTSDEAKAHRWSQEFRLKLFRNGNLTLLEDIASQEELEIVLLAHHSTQQCELALRRCTPTTETMEKFMDFNKNNFIEVCDLARAIPSAFKILSAKTLWGNGDTIHRELMDIVVRQYPERSLGFLKLLLDKKELSCEERKNVNFLALTALDAKIDLSEFIPRFKKDFLSSYQLIRENIFELSWMLNAFKAGFNETKSCLVKNEKDLRTASIYGSLTPDADALAWVYIGYKLMDSKAAFADIILDNWEWLKGNLGEKAYDQLCEKLARKAPEAHQAAQAVGLVGPEWQSVAIQHLLSFRNAYQTAPFFPFEGWTEAQQKEAVKLLVRAKKLSYDKLSELSGKLWDFAIDEMEVSSEIEALNNNCEEAIKIKLHEESEIFLLTGDYKLDDFKKAYLSTFEISDKVFEAWVNHEPNYQLGKELIKTLIKAYAVKWGLNPEKYRIMMTSSRAYLAPQLKKHVA